MVRLAEIARIYSVSRGTVYNWLKNGLKSYRVLGTLFFDLKEVEEWMKSQGNKQ